MRGRELLRSTSDQRVVSLCNIASVLSRRSHENEGYNHPTRIPLIDYDILSVSDISNVWQQERRICGVMLEIKGLIAVIKTETTRHCKCNKSNFLSFFCPFVAVCTKLSLVSLRCFERGKDWGTIGNMLKCRIPKCHCWIKR